MLAVAVAGESLDIVAAIPSGPVPARNVLPESLARTRRSAMKSTLH